MPRVVVLGGGIVGLSTGMLLADRIAAVAAEHEPFVIPGPSRADVLASLS